MDIFSQLLSHLDTDFDSFFDTLKGILIKGLQDSSFKVRLAALNGTVHFLIYRSRSRPEFQPFLPHMYEVCQRKPSINYYNMDIFIYISPTKKKKRLLQ